MSYIFVMCVIFFGMKYHKCYITYLISLIRCLKKSPDYKREMIGVYIYILEEAPKKELQPCRLIHDPSLRRIGKNQVKSKNQRGEHSRFFSCNPSGTQKCSHDTKLCILEYA